MQKSEIRFDNNFKNNKEYVSLSGINKNLLKEMHLPKQTTVLEVKDAFKECSKVYRRTGLDYDINKQRIVGYVNKFELYHEVIKGVNREKRR